MKKTKENKVFIIFCSIMILYHLLLQLNYGDGVEYFSKILGNTSLIDFWKMRYQGWSSRIIIETVLILITKVPVLWRILDCVIWIAISCLMCDLLEIKDKDERNFLNFLFLLYPFFDMGGAGWMATTVNYLWPFFFFLILCKGVKQYKDEKNIALWKYPVLLFSAIFASNQEQSAILVFAVLLYGVIWFVIKKKRPPLFLILEFFISVGSIIFILSAPGNQVRKVLEMERFPGYDQLTFFDKMYMGLLRIEKVFIASSNSIFILFCIVVFYVIYKKYKTKLNLMVSVVPLLILGGYTILCNLYPNYGKIFFIPDDVYQIEWLNYRTYIPVIYLIAIIFSILFSLFQIFKREMEKLIFCVLMLGVGVSTVAVMGFSPSIYASGNRTSFYLYFVLIFVVCYVIHERKDIFCFQGKTREMIMLFLALWGTVSFVNIICCIAYTIFA